ncbi:MAG: low temperature requirement protein A [Paracoccaceae bacterium]
MTRLLRPITARDPHESHRVSTQLELFFDLVIVIGIAALTAALHHAISDGHGLEKLPNFIFLFLALWWAWMNYTWFSSAFDNDDALTRFLTLVIMAGALIFAGGIGFIFETLDFSFGIIGWIVMRIGMVGLWLRTAVQVPKYRKTALRYVAGISMAQVLWVVYYFTTTPGSPVFYAASLLLFAFEWSVPVWAEKALRTPFHRHHIIERYGLLTIIVLGEVLLSVALAFGLLLEGQLDPALVVIALSGLVTVFALWWIYFAEAQHLNSDGFWRTFLWGYGHLFLFAAVAIMGAGLAALFDIVTDHSKATRAEVQWFIGAPLAVALLTIWGIRDRFMALGARHYALPTGAAAILVALALQSHAAIYAAITVAVLLWRVPFSSPDASKGHNP